MWEEFCDSFVCDWTGAGRAWMKWRSKVSRVGVGWLMWGVYDSVLFSCIRCVISNHFEKWFYNFTQKLNRLSIAASSSSSSLLKQNNNHRMCPINVWTQTNDGMEEDLNFRISYANLCKVSLSLCSVRRMNQ